MGAANAANLSSDPHPTLPRGRRAKVRTITKGERMPITKDGIIIGLTDAELAEIPAWDERWKRVIMSCEPINQDNVTDAISRLYAAAGLSQPRIITVPSPLVLSLAGPIAAGVWWLRRETRDATRLATREATRLATDEATYDATRRATRDATSEATRDATSFLLHCIGNYWRAWNGGNQWASWCCYLSFFRDIVGLKLPQYTAYAAYEDAAICAGPRYMRPEFCMVSDRPEWIHTDADNRPHADGKAAIRWRDGWSLYYLNGVRVPPWLAETSSGRLDPLLMHQIDNAEVRAQFVRKVGLERLLYKLDATLIDAETVIMRTPIDGSWPCKYALYEMAYAPGVRRRVLKMDNASLPSVEHVEYVPTDCKTVREAMNFRLRRQEKDVDDINGSPWWLHGDVVVVPNGARKVKRWPEVIA